VYEGAGDTVYEPVGSNVEQSAVSNPHATEQRSVPPLKAPGTVAQVCPPRSAPSHASAASRTPLPHVVQLVVIHAPHDEGQVAVPPVNPRPSVLHAVVMPRQHPRPLSHKPSQLSSRPLHVSAGGAQTVSETQPGRHARVPVELHVVVQLALVPDTHGKPSSRIVSQSSSTPLHVSAGGVHEPQPHAASHVRVPADMHDVVHAPVAPRAHV
jgi:hypothetical protein